MACHLVWCKLKTCSFLLDGIFFYFVINGRGVVFGSCVKGIKVLLG